MADELEAVAEIMVEAAITDAAVKTAVAKAKQVGLALREFAARPDTKRRSGAE